MGFCFFNNVAIAAEELLARGVGPVAIVDFDVHHGNGTQDHFWERSDAFFVSVHRYGGFYPGSGGADEIGAGRGRGFTRNVPLAAGPTTRPAWMPLRSASTTCSPGCGLLPGWSQPASTPTRTIRSAEWR